MKQANYWAISEGKPKKLDKSMKKILIFYPNHAKLNNSCVQGQNLLYISSQD